MIVSHRLGFVDRYSLRASGLRGSGRCIIITWVCPARGKRRGRSGEAGEASFYRAPPALLGARVLHVLRGAHVLVPRAACEARVAFFCVAGESMRAGSHILRVGVAWGRLKLRFYDRTKKFRIWTICPRNASVGASRVCCVVSRGCAPVRSSFGVFSEERKCLHQSCLKSLPLCKR